MIYQVNQGIESDFMCKKIIQDINTIMEKDPAAKNRLEIVLCYPGLHAIWMHRISSRLYRYNRITSYNVCYTKLLRCTEGDFIMPRFFASLMRK